MNGGGGNDTYVVDNAADVVTEAADQGTDVIQSTVNRTLSDNIEPARGSPSTAPATHWLTPSSATPRPTRSTAWPEWM